MTKTKRNVTLIMAATLALAAVVSIGFYFSFGTGQDGHASFVRWMDGESGAEQDVNDAFTSLQAHNGASELERFADGVLQAYATPDAGLAAHPSLPHPAVSIDKLPSKFWNLGGSYPGPPKAIVRLDKNAVVLQWGGGRHEIMIFGAAPANPPTGFYGRKVSERVYVIASGSARVNGVPPR